MFLGLWRHHPDLCLDLQEESSICVSVSTFPLKFGSHVGLGAHSNDLALTGLPL